MKYVVGGLLSALAIVAMAPTASQAQLFGMAECRAGYVYSAEKNMCLLDKKAKKKSAKKVAKKAAKKTAKKG